MLSLVCWLKDFRCKVLKSTFKGKGMALHRLSHMENQCNVFFLNEATQQKYKV